MARGFKTRAPACPFKERSGADPRLIGHSFSGLIVQILLDQGCGARASPSSPYRRAGYLPCASSLCNPSRGCGHSSRRLIQLAKDPPPPELGEKEQALRDAQGIRMRLVLLAVIQLSGGRGLLQSQSCPASAGGMRQRPLSSSGSPTPQPCEVPRLAGASGFRIFSGSDARVYRRAGMRNARGGLRGVGGCPPGRTPGLETAAAKTLRLMRRIAPPRQCHSVFAKGAICIICGPDPLVRSRPPGRLDGGQSRAAFIGEQRVQGDPCGPGNSPHNLCKTRPHRKTK